MFQVVQDCLQARNASGHSAHSFAHGLAQGFGRRFGPAADCRGHTISRASPVSSTTVPTQSNLARSVIMLPNYLITLKEFGLCG